MTAFGSADFYLRTGPFVSCVSTRIPRLLEEIALLYEGFPVNESCDFADFHLSVVFERRWYRPKVQFYVDGQQPYEPLPLAHAMPLFEWALNWCTATYGNQYLMIHAAAVERDGCAAILPGKPGSGKSTLTAALVNRGWRLLSDELTLISLDDGQVFGLARPISLKNQSIELIREFEPSSVMSRVVHDTAKGRVALLKAPADSVKRMNVPAHPKWVIFPKFRFQEVVALSAKSKAASLIELVDHAFNYNVHGIRGFTRLADTVDACRCYEFTYSRLQDAIRAFDKL